MKEDTVIIVENLTKTFGEFTAVNNISFEVKKAEIFEIWDKSFLRGVVALYF